jgi:hypothetical protein
MLDTPITKRHKGGYENNGIICQPSAERGLVIHFGWATRPDHRFDGMWVGTETVMIVV